MIPKTFGKIFSGQTRQKWNFINCVCLVTTHHIRKRTVKRGGGSVMVAGCFAASGPEACNLWHQEFCSVPENPEGECQAISL